MNFRWDKKYLYWGITAFVVLACGILFYYLVFHNSQFATILKNIVNICFPIIDGLIIAFLLCPLINWMEKKVFVLFRKKENRDKELTPKQQKITRALSITVSYVLVLLCLTAFVLMVVPQIKLSIENIIAQSSMYRTNIESWINDIAVKNPNMEDMINDLYTKYSDDFTAWSSDNLIPKAQELLKTVSLSVFNFFGALWDIIIGAIVSVYVLSHKEEFSGQFKKLAYGFLGIKTGNILIANFRMANFKFSGFIVGKILDSIIIGIICFAGCSIFQFPYPVLLGLIIGVTNVIPFFGPFFGAIPCALLIFMINPIQCIYFLIFILLLQQFDGNILGPKILGESTGISSFWVIFSITLFGGLWGVPGMIVGVPLFAVIYAIIKTALEKKLSAKELPVETDEYIKVDYIDTENENNFVPLVYDDDEEDEKKNKLFRFSRKKKNKNKKQG